MMSERVTKGMIKKRRGGGWEESLGCYFLRDEVKTTGGSTDF